MKQIKLVAFILLFIFTSCANYNAQNNNIQPIESETSSYDNNISGVGRYNYSRHMNSYDSNAPKSINKKANSIFRYSFPKVKIGLMLPLSGRYSSLGNDLLDAAQMAMFNLNESNFILYPVDTKGTSYGAIDAADELLLKDVQLVLGPLFSDSAKAVVKKFKERDINVISFSNDKKLTDYGVFILGYLPEQQIKRIVEYAYSQEISDYSIILPNNFYGASTAKQIRSSVGSNENSSVLKSEFYRIDKSGNPIKLKKHVFSAYNAALNKRPQREYVEDIEKFIQGPVIYPRAMIIPEGGSTLQKITDLLTSFRHDSTKVQLLGNSKWLEVDAIQNPVLQGGWFAAPEVEKKLRFDAQFKKTYNRKPEKIASLAYDGVALAATIARMNRGKNFSSKTLTNPRGFSGVDGIFRFQENGKIERGFAVYKIENNKFHIINKAPSTFFEVKNEKLEKSDIQR